MTKPFLYYSVKPFGINQLFGVNKDYYQKFGWLGHNGIDYFSPHATPLYAPCDGEARYVQDSHGGDGIYIKTLQGSQYYNVILWHLCGKEDPVYHPLIPMDGSTIQVKIGALIGYTDNSGAPYESSGDHLHRGLQPCDSNGVALFPNNSYGGCIDEGPYQIHEYAQDVDIEEQIVEKAAEAVQVISGSSLPKETQLSFYAKVVELLKSLFIK